MESETTQAPPLYCISSRSQSRSPPSISFYPGGTLGCPRATVHPDTAFIRLYRYTAEYACIVSDMGLGPNGTMNGIKRKKPLQWRAASGFARQNVCVALRSSVHPLAIAAAARIERKCGCSGTHAPTYPASNRQIRGERESTILLYSTAYSKPSSRGPYGAGEGAGQEAIIDIEHGKARAGEREREETLDRQRGRLGLETWAGAGAWNLGRGRAHTRRRYTILGYI